MSIIKKISVLFIILSLSIAYPMERSLELYDESQHVTFKSLKGFPLTSINKGQQWFSSLSETDRKSVTKKIVSHNDERLMALFNIATLQTKELQSLIAQRLYRDHEQVHDFLHMPITQAYCYEGFLDIINDEENAYFKERCFEDKYFKPDIICSLAKEITVLSSRNEGPFRNKENLEAIAKVVETFQDSFSKESQYLIYCNYQYYELPTLKRFIKERLRYLPFFLSFFMTLALPAFDICGVDERGSEFNVVANNFNAEAVRAYKATGNKMFLDKRVALRDEHMYCLNPLVYMTMASWLSACIPMWDLSKEVDSRLMDKTTLKDVVNFLTGSLFVMMVKYIASQSTEQPILGASCVTGLYLLVCCAYNASAKRPLKYDCVLISKLPALLQRRDIRIV